MVLHIHDLEFHIPGEAYFKTTVGKLVRGFGGFSRDANLLVGLSLIGNFGWAFFGLVMPLYLRALKYDLVDVGILMAVGTLAIVLMLIPAGIITDRFGRKWTLIVGSIFNMLAFGIFFACPPIEDTRYFNIYILANILSGLSNAFTIPAMNALLASKCSERQRKYLFTLNSFASIIGSAFGMLLVGILPAVLVPGEDARQMISLFQTMFLLAFVMQLIKTVGLFMVSDNRPLKKTALKIIPESWDVIKLFAITNILIGFGAGLVVPWFQVYFRERFDASYSDIGYVYAIQQFILAFLILLMPLFAERSGSVKTIVLTQAIAIGVLVMIPNSPIFALAAVAFVIRAVLMNVAIPIQDAFMNCAVKENDWAAAKAIQQLCWTAAWSVGTYVAGYVMEWNRDAPFFITAGFYTAYVVLFYMFFRKMKEVL